MFYIPNYNGSVQRMPAFGRPQGSFTSPLMKTLGLKSINTRSFLFALYGSAFIASSGVFVDALLVRFARARACALYGSLGGVEGLRRIEVCH